MTVNSTRGWTVAALVTAVLAAVGSVGLVATASTRVPAYSASQGRTMMQGSADAFSSGGGSSMMGSSSVTGGMMGGSMMGGSAMGHGWLAGNGVAVTSLAAARQRAAQAALTRHLHPGEVIWFDNGFYVELKDGFGNAATEVIVDSSTGAVGTEPGPAMMWNTRYGMASTGRTPATPAVSAERAGQLAGRWLAANRPGRSAATADSYPGYYTLETTVGGRIDGMLSVNSITGAVWPHTWHGRFLAKEDR